ncbi:hypothetical protein ACE1CI_03225 [Aerosakkonemataceae cyanobacterium BLCC-F50]|uniref:Uncharacterized protein n=1 Tax=Floridaenema flaviceps BLCC-F50 TaxID=3153642 RepID=A0ABV4XJQ2_9CYAN
MVIAVIEQQSNTDIIPIPNTVKEAELVIVPILVSALAFGFREVVVARLKRRSVQQAAFIEMQKAEQKEKSDRIEYLEKQNQMLLNEILDLRKILQMSGPLSLSMYDPSKKS